LLVENETIKEAINATNNEVGPDLAYDNHMLYYPSAGVGYFNDVGNYKIPHGPSKPTTAETSYSYALSSANVSVFAACLLPAVKELCAFQRVRRKNFL
jgi:hypothetical protein